EDAGRPLAEAREPARSARLHVGAPGQEAALHGRRARAGAGVEPRPLARLAPARAARALGRAGARPGAEPRVPRRARALGLRPRPGRVPLARAERRLRERAGVRALLGRGLPRAGLRVQPRAGAAGGVPARTAAVGPLARA